MKREIYFFLFLLRVVAMQQICILLPRDLFLLRFLLMGLFIF